VLVGRPPGCRILSKQKEATDEEPSGFRRSRGEREETGTVAESAKRRQL